MDVHPSNAKCVKDLQTYKNVKIIIQTLNLLYLPQTEFQKKKNLPQTNLSFFFFELLVYLGDIHRADFVTKLPRRLRTTKTTILIKHQNR